jgi:hypothetical protein
MPVGKGALMAKKGQKNVKQDDIKIRIRKLKRQAEEITAGQMVVRKPSHCPAEVKEQFWKYVVAFEQATWSQPFQVLIESGISLPSPDELEDSQLTAKLSELFNALALLRVYLHHTDHLSDRELYAQLWNDSLREEMVLQPDNADFACHVDLIGSGSEEDIHIYLKYYADENERNQWAKEWPGEPMPDREQHPFDRDRHLPQTSFGEEFGVN